ncbi:MAG TPA: UDP-N-acetylglucosamine 2-epimerase [Phycisphaerales bacterium]|nr:UDP-N-acetylglucosamine 2-epimerase [Phycisphaerales bacterium]
MTKKVAVITGSRAEFGLLDPVIRAMKNQAGLDPLIIVAGSHFLPPAETRRDVEKQYDIAARVEMQTPGATGRTADAHAVARGIAGFTDSFARLNADWVVVLGDRIEAFAAASAASVMGLAVAHIHGGDRAEGIADEAMRHAITKLSHLHLAATRASAERIARMGEPEQFIHTVGSPAIDGLASIEPLNERRFRELGEPQALFLLHPAGLSEDTERAWATAAIDALGNRRVLALMPNFDAGREPIVRTLHDAREQRGWTVLDHLPRHEFVALLKRLAASDGFMIGNSSAALIEAAALKLPAIDLGPRQSGRERADNVVHADAPDRARIAAAIEAGSAVDRAALTHPYGDGRSGDRIAALLARLAPRDPAMLRKRCAY